MYNNQRKVATSSKNVKGAKSESAYIYSQLKDLKREIDTKSTGSGGSSTPTTVSVKVNSTTTLPPGSAANVTNVGDDINVRLDIAIPAGTPGTNGTNGYTPVKGTDYFDGDDGVDGVDGESATVNVHSTVTLPYGQSAAVTNMGTSNAASLKFEIPEGKEGPKGDTGGDTLVIDTMPIGAILDFPGDIAPNGWLMMGPNYSRTAYPELYNVIGTKFGAGNGSTTFGTNVKGRVFVGLDTSQTEFNTIGKIGGHKLLQVHGHGLSDPGHTHQQQVSANPGSGGPGIRRDYQSDGAGFSFYPQGISTIGSSTGISIQNTGGGDSQNLQPYVVTNKIIKAFNVSTTSSVSTVINNFDSESPTDSASAQTVHDLKVMVDAIGTGIVVSTTQPSPGTNPIIWMDAR